MAYLLRIFKRLSTGSQEIKGQGHKITIKVHTGSTILVRVIEYGMLISIIEKRWKVKVVAVRIGTCLSICFSTGLIVLIDNSLFLFWKMVAILIKSGFSPVLRLMQYRPVAAPKRFGYRFCPLRMWLDISIVVGREINPLGSTTCYF